MNWYRRLLVAESHSYSTVMFEIHGDLRDRINSLISEIPEEDIAEEGREDNPHVTVLYGLHTGSAELVREHLSDDSEFEVKLGKISKFTTSDEHDVLKIEVESDELKAMNKKLKELDHTSTHPRYNAHLTLAYVKKGHCEDMVGSEPFPERYKVEEVVFSSKTEKKTSIPLGDSHEED
jgi:2'-5' RNA ligase